MLADKYRPTRLEDVVAQDRAVKCLRGLMGKGLGGLSLTFIGPSGVGKSTLAKIAAASVADDLFIREYIGAEVTLGTLGEIEREWNLSAWGKGGRAYVFNEFHALRGPVQNKLLDMLERIPGHVLICMTTTWSGEEALFDGIDGKPLLQRCIDVPISNQGCAKAFAEHVRTIAMAEGLDGQPVEAYVRLANKCKNSCRAMFMAVQSGAMLS